MRNYKDQQNNALFTEEEAQLWKEYWSSETPENSRIQLVELYLPLVSTVVNSLSMNIRQQAPQGELLSAGVVGLHAAISAYSSDKGVPFPGFAYKRIKGAILDDLRGQDHLTRTQRDYYKAINNGIEKLREKLSREPTIDELSAEINLPPHKIKQYLNIGHQTLGLDDEFADGLRYFDILEDRNSNSPSDTVHNTLAIESMRHYFKELEEREQKILFLRYFEELSVKEIAVVMGLTEGRISQIYKQTLEKMRKKMDS